MLSNVGNGWCTFKFNRFTGHISYLCDPIFQLGEVLLAENGVTVFDEEGSSFDFVISEGYHIYVVSHREATKLWTMDTTVENLIQELIQDIQDNFDAWVNWFGYCEDDPIEEMRAERTKEINELLKKLTEKVKSND